MLENLKEVSYWKKNIDEEHVMREADKISELEVKRYLVATGLIKNKYWKYYLEP